MKIIFFKKYFLLISTHQNNSKISEKINFKKNLKIIKHDFNCKNKPPLK
jgi:hypothetical protein